MLSMRVLGVGCSNCKYVEKMAVKAATNMGIEFQVEKLTDPTTWYPYAIMATPGLVINEKLVCAGRVPKAEEVTAWITNALSV